MKKCKNCNIVKPFEDFYAHKETADKHTVECKKCKKKRESARNELKRKDPVWVEKEKERGREKYYRLGYKNNIKNPEKIKKIMDRHVKKYPEKKLAKNKTQRMNRAKGKELHHWSYNPAHHKDVIELSVRDHRELHRYIIYDKEKMMYRTKNGMLLYTKEAHIEYINSLKTNNNGGIISIEYVSPAYQICK